MDRSQVAEHYRARGYQIRENAKLRGKSGTVHGVELVAEGPLGALLVSFGDVAGVDAPEMSSIRRIARDVGATPVLAAATFSNELRRLAPQLGVVLMDDEALAQPAPPQAASTWPATPAGPEADLEAHPWPASGRYKPVDPTRGSKAVEVDDMLAGLGEKPAPKPGQDLWPLRSGTDGAVHANNASGAGTVQVAAPNFDWLGKPIPAAERPAEASERFVVEEEAGSEESGEGTTREVAGAPEAVAARRRVAIPIEGPRHWVMRTLLYAFATAFFLWLFLR